MINYFFKVEYQDAFVLFNEGKITSIQSIIPALEMSNQVRDWSQLIAFFVINDEFISYPCPTEFW